MFGGTLNLAQSNLNILILSNLSADNSKIQYWSPVTSSVTGVASTTTTCDRMHTHTYTQHQNKMPIMRGKFNIYLRNSVCWSTGFIFTQVSLDATTSIRKFSMLLADGYLCARKLHLALMQPWPLISDLETSPAMSTPLVNICAEFLEVPDVNWEKLHHTKWALTDQSTEKRTYDPNTQRSLLSAYYCWWSK